MKVVLEIPDAIDPDAADQKYTVPLRQLLGNERVGDIVSVEQRKPQTPEEFSRIITVELTDYDGGMDVIQRFLVEKDAPPGTMIVSHDADGDRRHVFALAPPDDGE